MYLLLCMVNQFSDKKEAQSRDIYRPHSMFNMFGSVHVCACPSVCSFAVGTLPFELFDLDFWHKGRP